MSSMKEDLENYFGFSELSDEEFLEHYGMPRRSGRYPYDPSLHKNSFLSRVEKLKKDGWTETPENIKKEFGMNTSEYRKEKSLARSEEQMFKIETAVRLNTKGDTNGNKLTPTQIGKLMGVNESTVRGWLQQSKTSKVGQAKEVANMLKEQLKTKKMIDVGKDAEVYIGENGISKEKLNTALQELTKEGYQVVKARVQQPTNPDQSTTLKVLMGPNEKRSNVYNYDQIQTINDIVTKDGGKTFHKKFTYPESLDSKRLQIRYAEDGGIDKDGVIELRRGIDDLSLSGSRYAQVRIMVDGTHYLKGMAVYSDDMPKGVDVVFNTNKTKDKSMKDVLKPIKNDPDNPFGSAIKDADLGGQYWYKDKKTGKDKLGLINKRADEGDWTDWKDTLPSQFLGKQSQQLIEKQLKLAKVSKQEEYDKIMSLTNPVIKKYYLNKFADECDGAAKDLKAAALPGQKYHVIIPINSLSDQEVYAPRYKDGTKLALVRYPHGGIFEIPILTVNNKNKTGEKIIGKQSIDAIGINKNVADRLSGADFDGDTVMCLPTHDRQGRVKITNKSELTDLKGFDPKEKYGHSGSTIVKNGQKYYINAKNGQEFKGMTKTNLEMGKISNLITDMTLAGASDSELARAVKHSMVVIDAEKHGLDYRKSYADNNISELNKKYQTHIDLDGNVKVGGASSILSRAKSPIKVEKRRGQPLINIKGTKHYDPSKPEGSLIYKTAYAKDLYYADDKYDKKTKIRTIVTTDGKTISYDTTNTRMKNKYDPVMIEDPKTGKISFTSKDGKLKYKYKTRTQDVNTMDYVTDATTLIRDKDNPNPKEVAYAQFANDMKTLANKARVSMVNTPNQKYNPDAKKKYAAEISSLEAKLNNARKNTILERTATRLAAQEIKEKTTSDMSKKDKQKIAQRSMVKYREEVGSKSRRERNIEITDKEWEAIQKGAISNEKLNRILNYADPDKLRQRSMPTQTKALSKSQINVAKAMANSNFSIAQIAERLGVSSSTVSKILRGDY